MTHTHNNDQWRDLKKVECPYTIIIEKMFRNICREPSIINRKLASLRKEKETPAPEDNTNQRINHKKLMMMKKMKKKMKIMKRM